MALTLMYITNSPEIAMIAQKYGVDRIWIDLETLGKEKRQAGLNTVKSRHTINDIRKISPLLSTSQMLVRVNPWNPASKEEIDAVIDAGAELVMLPMWKSADEVREFVSAVSGRAKTVLLLETKEAEECLDDVVMLQGIDEVHIGLNDLHLSYGCTFMFELLSNGTVERICKKLRGAGLPYGFGGFARIGDGRLPAEKIVMEHYRLGSTRAILSRGFCSIDECLDLAHFESEFSRRMIELRRFEAETEMLNEEEYALNQRAVWSCVSTIADEIRRKKNMTINRELIRSLRAEYGDAFYLLDSEQFRHNFFELKSAFASIYPNFNIAYSYKTNYTPKLCKIVDELGGYAEVVSEMELELAQHIGVATERIIWNGPIKESKKLKGFLLSGGIVHIDSIDEALFIAEIADSNSGAALNVGIRCNYDVHDGVLSRFGFDVDGSDFETALVEIKKRNNIRLVDLHCHFAKRQIEYWPARAKGMVQLIDRIGIIPKRIDIGGGLFGKMADDLKAQFTCQIPDYMAYASAAATVFAERFRNEKVKPELVIEPGSALVGDCMKFVGCVKTIKKVRGKYFASILGSQKNISMTGINPPIEVIAMGEEQREYIDMDMVGFTCIEGDVLYRNYQGLLAVDDAVVISNCGSYSLVMKPPFILPNFPVLDICGDKVEVIKRQETFDDIFHTFNF